jgi:hypothetical protein
LFRQLGQVEEEPNGNFKVTRNGQTLILHPSSSKDVSENEEVMSLRHFLKRSEPELTPGEGSGTDPHWLLVIDHHKARIFRSEMHGAVPQRILPHDPDDFFRHAQDSKEVSRGQEKPDPNSFFEPVARVMKEGKILVFGTGTGTSNEMDQFIVWLKSHHPDQAARIIGAVVVNESHLSENQLLAKAREFYAKEGIPDAEGTPVESGRE